MKNKKTSPRVIVNTCLLLALTIFFGLATKNVFFWTNNVPRGYIYNSNPPHLCFEKEEMLDGGILNEGAYICSVERDENGKPIHLTDDEDYALFIQNQMTYVFSRNWSAVTATVLIFGIMLTAGSLVATIVYWNHNRGR
ncbi:hypothetical protein IJG76_00805 [Candidatus Saccharibacteria bacterium]|nr:hypothetical protein [Candidatus Saccharibacteria bacterium]